MMPNRNTRWWVVLVAVLIASPAAMPAAYDASAGVRLDVWLVVTASAVFASACLLVSSRCDAFTVWSLAALAPLATSAETSLTGGGALIATSLAVTLLDHGSWRHAAGVLSMSLACACDVTAMVLPIGCTWHAVGTGQWRRASVFIAMGLAGSAAGWWVMWSVADPPLTRLAVHETHRTVMLLLPVLMLGWAGQAARPGASSRADVMPWFRVWCLAASIGLGLGLTGLGVNVLLCVLLWWWRVPSGLADLRALIGHSRTGGGVRYVGVLVGMVLAILAVPGLRGWFGGVLMGWLLLTEGM